MVYRFSVFFRKRLVSERFFGVLGFGSGFRSRYFYAPAAPFSHIFCFFRVFDKFRQNSSSLPFDHFCSKREKWSTFASRSFCGTGTRRACVSVQKEKQAVKACLPELPVFAVFYSSFLRRAAAIPHAESIRSSALPARGDVSPVFGTAVSVSVSRSAGFAGLSGVGSSPGSSSASFV